MKRRTCFFAVCTAIITLLCVLVAFCFPVLAADHDCTGDDCAVCAVISLCRSLTVSTAAAAIFAVISAIKNTTLNTAGNTGVLKRSPISLKVKLLS